MTNRLLSSATAERETWSVIRRFTPVLSLCFGALAAGCMGSMGAPPVPADCKPLTNRACSCNASELGVQSCDTTGAYWGECRCSCEPFEQEECGGCEAGRHGVRECDATGQFWLACQCLDEGEELAQHADELQDPSCSLGEAMCPGVGCVSLGNSAANCGLCGRACEGCDRCFLGACTTVCCADEANCGTASSPICSDLDSDADNCGACGLACGDGEICVQGSCQA